MRRTFLLNYWSQTHRAASCKNEVELRAYATKIAHDRKTTVGFYEVIDGKVVTLGVVSGYVPKAAVERAEPKKAKAIEEPAKPVREFEKLSVVE